MAGIYCSEIYCDDCIDDIKKRVMRHYFYSKDVLPNGSDCAVHAYKGDLVEYLDSMDERDYDSDEFPKYCSGDTESDCPQHCGSGADCLNPEETSDGTRYGYFFCNDLTADGNYYVKEAVDDALVAGRNGPAVELWMPYYDYIDYIEKCSDCDEYGRDLDDEQIWSNIWIVSDHGNWELLSE